MTESEREQAYKEELNKVGYDFRPLKPGELILMGRDKEKETRRVIRIRRRHAIP
ncbi:MAG: hypothetical protein Q6373_004700 [Candidatus Sigynarchaeota archaeon]